MYALGQYEFGDGLVVLEGIVAYFRHLIGLFIEGDSSRNGHLSAQTGVVVHNVVKGERSCIGTIVDNIMQTIYHHIQLLDGKFFPYVFGFVSGLCACRHVERDVAQFQAFEHIGVNRLRRLVQVVNLIQTRAPLKGS